MSNERLNVSVGNDSTVFNLILFSPEISPPTPPRAQEGGETAFPSLNITVRPKRGRALLWPSVRELNLEHPDHRTSHEARPVVTGLKYAANAWLHLYDFRGPHKVGCVP